MHRATLVYIEKMGTLERLCLRAIKSLIWHCLSAVIFKLKTLQRKLSQIASFEKTAVKVFNSHMKHWIKRNVDAQI